MLRHPDRGNPATRFTGATQTAEEFLLLGRYVVDGVHKTKLPFNVYKKQGAATKRLGRRAPALWAGAASATGQPLTLEAVLATADAPHPDLDLARARQDVALADVRAAESLRFPGDPGGGALRSGALAMRSTTTTTSPTYFRQGGPAQDPVG